jgi:hypothetical protein
MITRNVPVVWRFDRNKEVLAPNEGDMVVLLLHGRDNDAIHTMTRLVSQRFTNPLSSNRTNCESARIPPAATNRCLETTDSVTAPLISRRQTPNEPMETDTLFPRARSERHMTGKRLTRM